MILTPETAPPIFEGGFSHTSSAFNDLVNAVIEDTYIEKHDSGRYAEGSFGPLPDGETVPKIFPEYHQQGREYNGLLVVADPMYVGINYANLDLIDLNSEEYVVRGRRPVAEIIIEHLYDSEVIDKEVFGVASSTLADVVSEEIAHSYGDHMAPWWYVG